MSRIAGRGGVTSPLNTSRDEPQQVHHRPRLSENQQVTHSLLQALIEDRVSYIEAFGFDTTPTMSLEVS